MKDFSETSRIEDVTSVTLLYAIGKAHHEFGLHDAVCFTGNSYFSLSDLAAWILTPSAAQGMVRRYLAMSGQVIEQDSGHHAFTSIVVVMVPQATTRNGEASRVNSNEPTFLFAVGSHRFMRTLPTWGQMQRVRPVALDDDGLKFEVA